MGFLSDLELIGLKNCLVGQVGNRQRSRSSGWVIEILLFIWAKIIGLSIISRKDKVIVNEAGVMYQM